MGAMTDEDLVVMRTRARHRLIGALTLVVMVVVGVPLLFDQSSPEAAVQDGQDSATPSADAAARKGAPGATDTALPANAQAPAASGGTDAASAATQPPSGEHPGGDAALPAGAAVTSAQPSGPVSTPASGQTTATRSAQSSDAGQASADSSVPAVPPRAGKGDAATPTVIPPLGRNGDGAGIAQDKDTRAAATATLAALPASTAVRAASGVAVATSGSEPSQPRGWFVQFGVFADAQRAESLSKRLEASMALTMIAPCRPTLNSTVEPFGR